jgi:hypothetical protein
MTHSSKLKTSVAVVLGFGMAVAVWPLLPTILGLQSTRPPLNPIHTRTKEEQRRSWLETWSDMDELKHVILARSRRLGLPASPLPQVHSMVQRRLSALQPSNHGDTLCRDLAVRATPFNTSELAPAAALPSFDPPPAACNWPHGQPVSKEAWEKLGGYTSAAHTWTVRYKLLNGTLLRDR